MPASLAHFQRRVHPVPREVILQLHQVLHRVLVVRVDGDPFAPLAGRVDSVQADRDLAFQVIPDRFLRQMKRRTGTAFLRAVVIMTAALRMGPGGLDGVSPAIYEQPRRNPLPALELLSVVAPRSFPPFRRLRQARVLCGRYARTRFLSNGLNKCPEYSTWSRRPFRLAFQAATAIRGRPSANRGVRPG